MQAKQMLMFLNRKDFYDWLIESEIAITQDELKNNEKKTSVIIPPLQSIVTYVQYVNYFQCDSIQTMAWSTSIEGEEKPQVKLMPIHISSLQYIPEEIPDMPETE